MFIFIYICFVCFHFINFIFKCFVCILYCISGGFMILQHLLGKRGLHDPSWSYRFSTNTNSAQKYFRLMFLRKTNGPSSAKVWATTLKTISNYCRAPAETWLLVHSTLHSFMHSSIHLNPSIQPSLTLFMHPWIHSSVHSFIHSLLQSFIHSACPSFIRSFIPAQRVSILHFHSFLHSFIGPFIQSIDQSIILPLIHSSIREFFSLIDSVVH